MNKSIQFQCIQRIVTKNLPSSIIAQTKLSILDVFLNFLYPLRQRIALLRSAKFIFVLIKFLVSEYDSFCFSLSFPANFLTVFVEPGADAPVQEKVSGRK